MQSQNQIQITDYQGALFRRFTGKEKDSESGYYYFGARYFMPTLSIWNSVDPMADKYPSLSPYNYCAWNPLKLVDPDGEDIYIGQYSDNKKSIYVPNSKANREGTVAGMLDKIYNGSRAGRFVINSLIKSDNNYFISEKNDPLGNGNPNYNLISGAVGQIYLNVSRHGINVGSLSHELFHAFQYDKKQFGKTISCEVEAFIFAGIVMSQMNGGELIWGKMSEGMRDAYTMADNYSIKSNEYLNAMLSLTKEFHPDKMATAVSRFRCFSMEGFKYGSDRGYKYCLTGNYYNGSSSLLNTYQKEIYGK